MNKHGRVSRGGAIHLIDERGYPLCGSGQSSHAHNFRSSRARFHTTDPLTCKKCLARKQGGEQVSEEKEMKNLFSTGKTYVWYGENGFDKPQTGREQTLEEAIGKARSYVSRLRMVNSVDRSESAHNADPKYRLEIAGTHFHPFAGRQRFMVQVIEET